MWNDPFLIFCFILFVGAIIGAIAYNPAGPDVAETLREIFSALNTGVPDGLRAGRVRGRGNGFEVDLVATNQPNRPIWPEPLPPLPVPPTNNRGGSNTPVVINNYAGGGGTTPAPVATRIRVRTLTGTVAATGPAAATYELTLEGPAGWTPNTLNALGLPAEVVATFSGPLTIGGGPVTMTLTPTAAAVRVYNIIVEADDGSVTAIGRAQLTLT